VFHYEIIPVITEIYKPFVSLNGRGGEIYDIPSYRTHF